MLPSTGDHRRTTRPPEDTVAVAGVLALGAEMARIPSSGERTWRQPSSPVLELTEAIVEAWGRGRVEGSFEEVEVE